MNSHTDSASALEASLLSSSPETVAPTLTPTPALPTVCDSATGVHAPGCNCAEKPVRINRGH